MSPLLLSLSRELRALPGSGELTVFGSMLDRPDTAGDLDVGWNRPDPIDRWTPAITHQIHTMLNLGGYGGPYYGSLDLFVPTPVCLLVRNDASTALVIARHARALRKAILMGEPFNTWYDRVIVPRLEQATEPVPTRQDLILAARARREAAALEREASRTSSPARPVVQPGGTP